jgi:DNA-binding response OmpR family regulator
MAVTQDPRIMIVEDDPSAKRLLELILSSEGFRIAAFENGVEALSAIDQFRPDLVVLDLMMPEMDGIEFARNVRAKKEFDRLPLLVLTAREQRADRYEAFLAGADDYLIKPFDPMELLFRIKSALRLSSPERPMQGEVVEVGPVKLEPSKYQATIDGRSVILTKLETAILRYLMAHAGQVFSAEQLSNQISDHSANPAQRSVDAAHAHIRHLRQKLEEDPKSPKIIVTMGRKGYYFAS